MAKQPVLTDFPRTVFATATRRAQASIQELRHLFSKDKISGYSQIFPQVLPGEFLQTHKPEGRDHHFGSLTVFWAWIAQILEGNASCTKAVSFVQAWCRVLKLPVPSKDSSAYCRTKVTD